MQHPDREDRRLDLGNRAIFSQKVMDYRSQLRLGRRTELLKPWPDERRPMEKRDVLNDAKVKKLICWLCHNDNFQNAHMGKNRNSNSNPEHGSNGKTVFQKAF